MKNILITGAAGGMGKAACRLFAKNGYNVFGLDVSYLVPVNNTATSGTNPLENTLRFSLTFNLDKWGDSDTKLEKTPQR